MADWGDKWGSKWGCEGLSLADICESWIWWQFRDKPNFKALCAVMSKIFSGIDEKLERVAARRGVNGAFGGELDAWGAMVDEPRNGMDDDLYRIAIRAKARTVLSQGRISDLADVAALIAPQRSVTFAQAFPACVRAFFSSDTTDDEIKLLLRLLERALSLGLCISFVEVDELGVFEFSYLNEDTTREEVELHWGHTDGDINPAETAGMAFTL